MTEILPSYVFTQSRLFFQVKGLFGTRGLTRIENYIIQQDWGIIKENRFKLILTHQN
jgi:hypothetical protein